MTGTITLALLVAAGAAAVAYEPYASIERGRDGLLPMAFAARNVDAPAMACAASLAHRYSEELGTAGPGGTVEAVLWLDPASGAVHLLNEHEDRMPVEALWCGLKGRAWATRSDVALSRRQDGEAAAIAVECRLEAERLVCAPLVHP